MLLRGPVPPGIAAASYVAMWSAVSVGLCTLTSRVIYGLRESVREARQLGQYTLVERIGAGGMGVVYRAEHAMLRRPTAVKVLPPEKAGEQTLRRFEREVQLTARLTHPNTIAIYDYGRTPDGLFYYAMEYLDGFTLSELVEIGGPLPPERVAFIIGQAAGSLGEAHRIGLIHRDIKPDNILVCHRGGLCDQVKVLDFGLVKDTRGANEPGLSNVDTIIGTPLYLAPEAITAADSVGPASDLYALGAVADFLLVGRHVFTGESMVEVCSHHVMTPPTPPSVALGRPVPARLEALIMACLAKKPEQRPSSADDVELALSPAPGEAEWSRADARAWWEAHRPEMERVRRERTQRNSTPAPESVTRRTRQSVLGTVRSA
jgi:eukaryotic-like serine/threonine-protein kinase